MPNWKLTLRFTPWFRDEDMPIEEKGKSAASALRIFAKNKAVELIEDDLLLLAENFETVTDVEEFDDFMEELYDMADLERIWVVTF